MKRDACMQSAYAGMIAATIYTLIELVAINIGLIYRPVWQVAAGMYLPVEQIFSSLGTLIGLIGHLAIGGFWGIIFYLFLLFFGLENRIYKGTSAGIIIWVFSTIMMRWGVTSYAYLDAYHQLVALLCLLIFGLSLGYLVPRMVFGDASRAKNVSTGYLEKLIAQPAYKPVHDEAADSEQDRIRN